MLQNLSSAAVVIGALRVKPFFFIQDVLNMFRSYCKRGAKTLARLRICEELHISVLPASISYSCNQVTLICLWALREKVALEKFQ